MSLRYIIDGYNIINHPLFIQQTTKRKKISDNYRTQYAGALLLEFIKINKLCKSPKNTTIVVFDGYPKASGEKIDTEMSVVFARTESADERIKKIVEGSGNARNTIVVSDDKEIRYFVKSMGAYAMGVEEFLLPAIKTHPILNAKDKKRQDREEASLEVELTYRQMDEINQELKKLWLK
jgi:predicted RNA-binding protein with PIN domain